MRLILQTTDVCYRMFFTNKHTQLLLHRIKSIASTILIHTGVTDVILGCAVQMSQPDLFYKQA